MAGEFKPDTARDGISMWQLLAEQSAGDFFSGFEVPSIPLIPFEQPAEIAAAPAPEAAPAELSDR